MAENTNLSLTVEAWADIVIKEWLKKIDALGIIHSGNLAESFERHVILNASGDPSRIMFMFNYYGKMVDYGVGKGITLSEREEKIALGNKRKQKQWYTSVFYKQLVVLRHLLEEKTAKNIEKLIVINSQAVGENSNLNSSSRKQVNPMDQFSYSKYAKIRGRQ